MPADASAVRQNYVLAMQAACRQALLFNTVLVNLQNLYLGDGLSGTFVDAELAASAGTKHLVLADVGTFTTNLNTIQAAMTAPIVQNMAKCVGGAGGVP